MPMTSVKIGGLRFALKEERDIYADEQKIDGDINYKNQTIRLEKVNPPETKDMILLHEILHGMFTLGINRDMGNDENFIMVVGYQLYSVMRDNPKLFIDMIQRTRA
jgi:hypothetical protein